MPDVKLMRICPATLQTVSNAKTDEKNTDLRLASTNDQRSEQDRCSRLEYVLQHELLLLDTKQNLHGYHFERAALRASREKNEDRSRSSLN